MAAGSLTAAALRHRPRQALLVAILAAVVSASAMANPLDCSVVVRLGKRSWMRRSLSSRVSNTVT